MWHFVLRALETFCLGTRLSLGSRNQYLYWPPICWLFKKYRLKIFSLFILVHHWLGKLVEILTRGWQDDKDPFIKNSQYCGWWWPSVMRKIHYNDVIMGAMASHITSLTSVLLNRLYRRRSKKTSKFRVTGLCAGNSPVTGEFPAQMASNAENVPIWWRHHERMKNGMRVNTLLASWGWFTNVSQALQSNLTNIYNARNHSYGENFKLKHCTYAQSMALGTRTKVQLEIPIRNIYKNFEKLF